MSASDAETSSWVRTLRWLRRTGADQRDIMTMESALAGAISWNDVASIVARYRASTRDDR